MSDDRPSNEEIMKQMDSIQEDQRKELLVGELQSISALVEEFKDATPTQKSKVKV